MSFDLKRSHFSLVLERPVLPGQVITEEGVALEAVLDTDGQEKVKVFDGTGVVCGFSVRDNADNATTSAVETVTVPASSPFTVQLANNDIVVVTGTTESASAHNDTAGSQMTQSTDGTPASGEFDVDAATGVVTFNSAQASAVVTITYRYNLTVAEARQKFFQRNINNEAGAIFGQVGVGMGHGEIYTDQFDAQVNWAAATGVKAIAGGLLSDQAATGQTIDARVISIPNVNNPLLGIAFNLGGAN